MEYNILWVDDDKKVVPGIINDIGKAQMKCTHFYNWEEANSYLNSHFDEVDAIVLDGLCLINKDDTIPSSMFLHHALPDMLVAFEHYKTMLPWYILSEGTMDRFDSVVTSLASKRKDFEEEWGSLVYYKSKDSDLSFKFDNPFDNYDKELVREGVPQLINQIKSCCVKSNFKAIIRHRDTFKYLGTGKLFGRKPRGLLLDILSSLYEPDKFPRLNFEGNPIRRIFECVIHKCVEFGIIPDEIREGGNVKCREASRFLSGENPQKLHYRYGEHGDRILDSTESSILIAILASTNVASHESAEDFPDHDVSITECNRDEYCGCALLMCRIIKALAKYIELNPIVDENKKRWTHIGEESPIGKEGIIKNIEGNLCILNCRLNNGNPKFASSLGKSAKIIQVSPNNGDDKDKFPFYANRIDIHD